MSECPDVTSLEHGRDDAAVAAHLAECAGCRRLVELMDVRPEPCEHIELLLAEVTLAAEDRARVERHIAGCDACAEIAALATDGEAAGEDHDRYRLGREVGRGGMGRVFDARDRQLERNVAVKVLRHGAGSEAEARFRREALVTARLQHPSIVAVYEMGHLDSGERFYAMRRIYGDTLETALDQSVGLDRRLALVPRLLAAAEAVAYAHSEGVFHRDLKPSNIMLGPFGETLVLDWGVAKLAREPVEDVPDLPYRVDAGDASRDLTRAGAVIGTPQYMSPEQARAEPVDERTDVYALGSILYCLLSGAPPYRGKTSREVVEQVRQGEPTPIDDAAPEAPPALRAIVAKAMHKDASARYRDADEFARDLERFHTGKLVSAHHYSAGQLVARWFRRNRAVVLTASALALALLVTAVVGVVSVVRERDRATEGWSEAKRQQKAADKNYLALMQDLGRQHLLDGRPRRAAVYLSAAYSAGADNTALRSLLADAMRVVETGKESLGVLPHITHTQKHYSPDGGLLAYRISKSAIGIWDTKSGKRLHTLEVENKHVVAWSGDTRLVAVGHTPLTVWEARTGRKVQTIDTHWEVNAMNRDGTRLYGSVINYTWTFDVTTGEKIALISRPEPAVWIGMTPDDRRVVLAGADGVIRFLDPKTLAVLGTVGSSAQKLFVRRYHPIGGIFDKTGRLVAIGPGSKRASVWREGAAKPELVLGEHSVDLLSASFSPDGDMIVTASADGIARVWSAKDGKRLFEIRGPGGQTFTGIVRGTKGVARLMVSNPEINTTTFYGLRRGLRVAAYAGTAVPNFGGGRMVLASRSENRFIDPGDDALRVDLPTSADGRPLRTPSAKLVVAHNFDRATVLDSASGLVRERLRLAHNGWRGSLSPLGDRVMEPVADGGVVIRAISQGDAGGDSHTKGRVLEKMRGLANVGTASFSTDGDFVVVTHRESGGSIWNATTGQKVAALTEPTDIDQREPAAVSSGATRIVTLRKNGSATLWDRAGKRLTVIDPGKGRIAMARFMRHGETFLLYREANPKKGASGIPIGPMSVTLRRSSDGSLLARLGETMVLPHVLWGETDPTGSRLLYGGLVWDTRTGAKLLSPKLGGPGVGVGSFSDDGKRVAIAGGYRGAKGAWVFDVDTGRQISRVGDGHAASVFAELDPTGTRVALSNVDGTLRLWDVDSSTELARIPTPHAQWSVQRSADGGDVSVALSVPGFGHDGRYLFTLDPDSVVRSWDVHLEIRPADIIADIVRRRVPFRLSDGRLVPR